MTYKKYFIMTIHQHTNGYRCVSQKELIIPEGMTVADLQQITGSSDIQEADVSSGVFDFKPIEGKLLSRKQYLLVNTDKEKLNAFMEQVKALTKDYDWKIPGTDYLMPPKGKERYPALLEKLVQELHK
jgi:hypothetical protein